MEYFAISPFYDHTCNNEVLKMQTKFNNLQELTEQLLVMKGTEYALVRAVEPSLFVICKRNRVSETQSNHLIFFFI
jgi:mediator of RNA polymerase II transcription subunit 6